MRVHVSWFAVSSAAFLVAGFLWGQFQTVLETEPKVITKSVPSDRWLERAERDTREFLDPSGQLPISFMQRNAVVVNFTAGVGTLPRFQVSALYMRSPSGTWKLAAVQKR